MSEPKHIVSSESLDHLLNQAFLELDDTNPKNEIIMQAISNEVMLTDKYSAAETGHPFKRLLRKINLNSILIFVTLSIVVLSLAFMLGKKTKPEAKGNFTQPLDESAVRSTAGINMTEPVSQNEIDDPSRSPQQNFVSVKAKDSLRAVRDTSIIDLHEFTQPEVAKEIEIIKVQKKDSGFVFPTLTEKEIKANHKQKKKMLEQLIKFNKNFFAYIPTGTYNYKGETISLFGFYIQSGEVTNLEYRTFLFDLLIADKKQEFLKARPDQQQWMKEFNRPFLQPMTENYFSHTAYNTYPVVNISREAAEMYCNWLTIEANKLLSEKNKPLINDVRIPTDVEWTYAASGGIKDGVYPWGPSEINKKYFDSKNYVRNSKGCFLANFSLKRYSGKLDSLSECALNKNRHPDAYTTAGYMLGHGTMTAPVYSYNPNDYGLYCMAGNVAEMVKITKENKAIGVGTKGGGWGSSDTHLRLDGADEYAGKTGPSVFVGFRPVISANVIK
jgi:formylglycine-generating enzyme required for sulfatase activity